MMRHAGPRAVPPRDGLDWLRQAFYLLLRRPLPFLVATVMAPAGAALLMRASDWGWPPLETGAWWQAIITAVCYGLPTTFAISLACGVARAANREHKPTPRQLFNLTVARALLKSTAFLTGLLAQAYLLAYWLKAWVLAASIGETANISFGVAGTLLATQLAVLGTLLLVFQFLGACFITPLQLFRERPLMDCWHSSFLAIQLNPWLLPSLSLCGALLLLLAFVEALGAVAQLLALPLPAYLGALLYVAWVNVFQGGIEEKATLLDEVLA